ncbi:unnamed protein product [Tuber aestivum]|uniref:Uncharacterized protein n=1 Tax=Tuber aestivum TaxID=59557 RepID=A0A292PX33_9PEZI|nr:unnamed protein product [Tuber aestivum]
MRFYGLVCTNRGGPDHLLNLLSGYQLGAPFTFAGLEILKGNAERCCERRELDKPCIWSQKPQDISHYGKRIPYRARIRREKIAEEAGSSPAPRKCNEKSILPHRAEDYFNDPASSPSICGVRGQMCIS